MMGPLISLFPLTISLYFILFGPSKAQPPPSPDYLTLSDSFEVDPSFPIPTVLPQNPSTYRTRKIDKQSLFIGMKKRRDDLQLLNNEDKTIVTSNVDEFNAGVVHNLTANNELFIPEVLPEKLISWIDSLETGNFDPYSLNLGSENITADILTFFNTALGSLPLADNLASNATKRVVNQNPFSETRAELAATIMYQLDGVNESTAKPRTPDNLVNLFKWWEELPANARERTLREHVLAQQKRPQSARVTPRVALRRPLEAYDNPAGAQSSIIPSRRTFLRPTQPNLITQLSSTFINRLTSWQNRPPAQPLFPRAIPISPRARYNPFSSLQNARRPVPENVPRTINLRVEPPRSSRPSTIHRIPTATAQANRNIQILQPESQISSNAARTQQIVYPNFGTAEYTPNPPKAKTNAVIPSAPIIKPIPSKPVVKSLPQSNVGINSTGSKLNVQFPTHLLVLPRRKSKQRTQRPQRNERERRIERQERKETRARKRSELEKEIGIDLELAQQALLQGQSAKDIEKLLSARRAKLEPNITDIFKSLKRRFSLPAGFSTNDIDELKRLAVVQQQLTSDKPGNLLSSHKIQKPTDVEEIEHKQRPSPQKNERRLNRKLNRILGRLAAAEEYEQNHLSTTTETILHSSPAPPPIRQSIRVINSITTRPNLFEKIELNLKIPVEDEDVVKAVVIDSATTKIPTTTPRNNNKDSFGGKRKRLLVWRHAQLLDDSSNIEQEPS